MAEPILQLPERVEDLILKGLGLENMDQNRIDSLRREMVLLAQRFKERKFAEDGFPDAHLAFNFPTNIIKVEWIIERLKVIYKELFYRKCLNVLDAGCGEGAGTVGLFISLPQKKDIRFTGVDISPLMIDRYRIFTQTLGINADGLVYSIDKGFFRRYKDQFTIIILSNILGEIQGDKLRFIKSALSSLCSSGILIVVEPALKINSRLLMEIKSKLKTEGLLLPCNHNKICPLLKRKDEWCYHSIRWVVPKYLELLNRKLFRNLKYLKFSYLIVAKDLEIKPDIIPVITPVWREKGRKRFFICRDGRGIECLRYNKDESEKNRDLDSIMKGDHIQLENFLKQTEERYLVLKETRVKRIC